MKVESTRGVELRVRENTKQRIGNEENGSAQIQLISSGAREKQGQTAQRARLVPIPLRS
jgi:hypothetical protein